MQHFVGIDVGSQGVRVVVINEIGKLISAAERKWSIQNLDDNEHEQDPNQWWNCICECLQELSKDNLISTISRISVVATSGTLLLLDSNLNPLYPAIMWNDKRAIREAKEANEIFLNEGPNLGLEIRPTFTLAKAMWMMRNKPEIWKETKYVVSAGDWLISKLTGNIPKTDFTNALKTGADLESLSWPKTLSKLKIYEELLPEIVAPGTALGTISNSVSQQTNLPTTCAVLAGVTDAMGAQIAAGVVEVGQWVTTIGTGLSIKGNTLEKMQSFTSGLYSHRAWNGNWSVSATSHCGGDSILQKFPNINFDEYTLAAEKIGQSNFLVLPLATRGEYFPFSNSTAIGFEKGESKDSINLFLGYLEGIAFIERLAMETITEFAGVTGPQVSMGGGASNSFWLQIRAETLGRPTVRPFETSSALGAAIIALAGEPTAISATAKRIVQYHPVVIPNEKMIQHRDSRYQEFLAELVNLDYWQPKKKISAVR
jgi:sugar (pentulose or hexulose) kinase